MTNKSPTAPAMRPPLTITFADDGTVMSVDHAEPTWPGAVRYVPQERLLACDAATFRDIAEAIGEAWLHGGVSLAEGVRRKTAALERLAEGGAANALLDAFVGELKSGDSHSAFCEATRGCRDIWNITSYWHRGLDASVATARAAVVKWRRDIMSAATVSALEVEASRDVGPASAEWTPGDRTLSLSVATRVGDTTHALTAILSEEQVAELAAACDLALSGGGA